MLTEIQAGLGGTKALFEIAKGIQALKSETAINQAVIDIQRHALEAQQGLAAAHYAHSALLKRVAGLEQEIARLKDWSAEKQRYELKTFIPGSIAYCLKPAMAGGEPAHRICPHCYQQGIKGFFQATGKVEGRGRVHRCASCLCEVVFGGEIARSTDGDSSND